MSELFYFSAGGLLPIGLICLPIIAGKSRELSPSNVILPIQVLVDKGVFQSLFLAVAVIFFFSNYKAVEYIIETFKKAPIPPKDFYNKILLFVSVGISFCLIGMAMLDFTHFTLFNNIFYAFSFIFMDVFYILIDIANTWAYYTPSSMYWFMDLFLSFATLIHILFNDYAFSSPETTAMNTSAIFGYILTTLMFIRYFLLYFEVKERIIQFENDTDIEEEEDFDE